MNNKDKYTYVREVEETRQKLREKRLLENRDYHLHDILNGFESTILATLFASARENGKDSIQAIYVFYAAVRLLMGDQFLHDEINQDSLVSFTEAHYAQIEQLLMENGLSKNMDQRALPILYMLMMQGARGPFNVIELGASSGLIGRALMKPEYFLENLSQYTDFSSENFEAELSKILELGDYPTFTSYVGVDLSIPTQEWNLACIEEDDKRKLLQFFLDYFPELGPNERLIEGDAIEFMSSPEVDSISNPLLVTSMMMYQLPDEIRSILEERVQSFLVEKGGYWAQLTYERDRNRFLAKLHGVQDNKVIILRELLLKDGDAMEWEEETR